MSKEFVVAVNAVFAVCQDRRDEFVAQFQNQIQQPPLSSSAKRSSDNRCCNLIQAVLGEDFDNPGTYHCHLKFEFSSLKDAHGDTIDASSSSSSSSRIGGSHRHAVFLNGPCYEWTSFEATDPFLPDSLLQSHVWIVAPLVGVPPKIKISNPKPQILDGDGVPQQQIMQLFHLNAKLCIQPEHRDDLVRILEHARSSSVQEPLCVEYQYGESMTIPNTFHVHQSYSGEEGGKEGFEWHAKTQHYQAWEVFAAEEPFAEDSSGYPFRTPIKVIASNNDAPADAVEKKEIELLSAQSPSKSYNDDIILLDGGNGHELKQRGVSSDGSFLAGVLANEKEPAVVRAVHGDFCRSGCRVITTNSFVAVPQRVQQDILTRAPVKQNRWHDSGGELVLTQRATQQRTRELIQAAVGCARDAANTHGTGQSQNVKVAGTVPPLSECYIPSLVPESVTVLASSYAFLLSTLIAEGVDILLAETLSTEREGIAIIRALSQVLETKPKSSLPLWLSFTIDDFVQPTMLRSGESLETTLDCVLEEAKERGIMLEAIGINCASPGAVTKAMPFLSNAVQRSCLSPVPRILVYANAFKTTTSEWLASLVVEVVDNETPIFKLESESITLPSTKDDYDKHGLLLPEAYANSAAQWVEMGASIVGGCCGCSPAHMLAVARKLALES